MAYYYLDGINKNGPLSLDQLKSLNLDPETLVFNESGSKNWILLKDAIEDSEKYITDTINVDGINLINSQNIVEEERSNFQNQDRKVLKLKIPYAIIIGSIIVVLFGLSYLLVEIEQNINYSAFYKNANKYLQGSKELRKVSSWNFSAYKIPLEYKVVYRTYLRNHKYKDYEAIRAGEKNLITKPELERYMKYYGYDTVVQAKAKYQSALKDWIIWFTNYHNIQYYELDGSITLKCIYNAVNSSDYYISTREFKNIRLKDIENLSDKNLESLLYNSIIRDTTFQILSGLNLSDFGYYSNKYYHFEHTPIADSKEDKYYSNDFCEIGYKDSYNWKFYLVENENSFIKYWLIYSLISSVVFIILIVIIKYRKKYKFSFSIKNFK